MHELSYIFDRLSDLLAPRSITIRIEHENLETVYVTRESDGTFLVSDRNHTFNYLENAKDSYLKPGELQPPIEIICERYGVEFVDVDANDPDLLPCMTILKRVANGAEVPEAVSKVAACVDYIFEKAHNEK